MHAVVAFFRRDIQINENIWRHNVAAHVSIDVGDRMTLAHAKRTVAMCGKFAKIITGKKIVNGESEAKTASAHDLRRSFAQRWAVRVSPQVLQQLMRHRDIATTMKYYADLDAETLATQIYELGGQSRKRAKSQKSKS